MPWSSGNYIRSNGTYVGASVWQDDNNAGFGIEDTRHDIHDEDLANGIDQCLNKAGENTPTANISMAGYIFTDMGGASNPGDSLNLGTADGRYIRTDGSSTVTADIPMNDNKLTGLADGVDPQDSATVNQIPSVEWANIDGTTGATNGSSGGVTCSRTGTGTYIVTFANASATANDQAITALASAEVGFSPGFGTSSIQINTRQSNGNAADSDFFIQRFYTPA